MDNSEILVNLIKIIINNNIVVLQIIKFDKKYILTKSLIIYIQ